MQADFDAYSSFMAVTPSDTTSVTTRGIFCGGAGNLVITQGQAGSVPVTFAVLAGSTNRLALDQGRINAASTATGIIALN